MDKLIAEIRAALANELFIVALQGTLAVVDVCASLGSADGRSTGARFKDWFTTHVGPTYPALSAEDMWLLRCGILHQGRLSSQAYAAILFTLPDGRGNVWHNNVINDALNLDLVQFSTEVLNLVETWYQVMKETEPVCTNALELVRYRQSGMAPYMIGVPMLA